MVQTVKICPQCQQQAALHSVFCAACGRKFHPDLPASATIPVAPPADPSAPTSPTLSAGKISGVRIFCWAALAGMLLTLCLLLVFARKNAPPPGPQTVAMADQMKQYLGAPLGDFQQRFGLPMHMDRVPLSSGGNVFRYRYDYPDGHVVVSAGEEVRVISSLRMEGVSVPAFPGGPEIHDSTTTETAPLSSPPQRSPDGSDPR